MKSKHASGTVNSLLTAVTPASNKECKSIMTRRDSGKPYFEPRFVSRFAFIVSRSSFPLGGSGSEPSAKR